MRKNFRNSLKYGAYLSLAMMIGCGSETETSSVPSETSVVESESKVAESDKPTETEQASAQATSGQTEPNDAASPVAKQIDELTANYKAALEVWKADYVDAETPEAKALLVKKYPKYIYSADLFKLYTANPDDKDAQRALRMALVNKSPKNTIRISKALQKLAGEQELADARKSYVTLVKHGYAVSQAAAANSLLELAEAEADDTIALAMLKPVASAKLLRKPKEAAEMIWERLKDKPEEADLVALTIVGLKASPESRAAAYEALLEHHRDDEDFASAIAMVPAQRNPAYEAVVKQIIKTGEGDSRTQAVVSLAQYIKVRDKGLDRERLDEEQLAKYDKEKQKIKEYLSTFDGDSELDKQAQAELFEIEHLSPGVEALDIVGTDLNGSELRLSDYRGKVIFLDFWGDW